MLKYYIKKAGTILYESIDKADKGCWIHIPNARKEDITELSKLTDIPEVDLEDSLDRLEMPRFEILQKNALFFMRHPGVYESGLYTATLTVILTPDYFITISPYNPNFIQDIFLEKSQAEKGIAAGTAMLSHIFKKISQQFTLEIKRVGMEVLDKKRDLSSVESEDIIDLTQHEEILNQYLSSLNRLGKLLGDLLSVSEKGTLETLSASGVQDLFHTVTQSEEICHINLKGIRSLRDSYQIIFANNLQKTIQRLTSLTIILSIPIMITSIYGMNVPLLGQNNPNAFSVIIFITFGALIISLVIFNRKKWL